MRETCHGAKASGVPLEDDLVERLVAMTSHRAPVVPSMLQDARASKPMEVESLCGKYL
jgi:ketopantoate reductase